MCLNSLILIFPMTNTVKATHLYSTLFRLCLIESALHATCNFPAQAPALPILCEGEPPPSIPTPWGAYRP